MSTMFTAPRPYVRKDANSEKVLEACQKAADSPILETCPRWVQEAIRNGKGGLKGRASALWVLYLHELESARHEAIECWGASYLPREHQETLAISLGDKPKYEARKCLEDALWALHRLERDASQTPTSPQRTSNRSKGKRAARHLKAA